MSNDALFLLFLQALILAIMASHTYLRLKITTSDLERRVTELEKKEKAKP